MRKILTVLFICLTAAITLGLATLIYLKPFVTKTKSTTSQPQAWQNEHSLLQYQEIAGIELKFTEEPITADNGEIINKQDWYTFSKIPQQSELAQIWLEPRLGKWEKPKLISDEDIEFDLEGNPLIEPNEIYSSAIPVAEGEYLGSFLGIKTYLVKQNSDYAASYEGQLLFQVTPELIDVNGEDERFSIIRGTYKQRDKKALEQILASLYIV